MSAFRLSVLSLLGNVLFTIMILVALLMSLSGCNDSPSVSPNHKESATTDAFKATEESSAHSKTVLPYRGLLVSNQPLYLLAKAATQRVELPKKIMTGADVGHHYHLKPSDRKHIKEANAIFWVGPDLEVPLAKMLMTHQYAMRLLQLPDIDALPMRDMHGKSKHSDQHGSVLDPHVWLDPTRAKAIVKMIAMQRAKQYPENKAAYLKNSKDFAQRMDEAVNHIKTKNTGSGIQVKPHDYIAYHDAYQYIEGALNLRLLGSLVSSANQPIKVSQLLWLKEQRQKLDNPKQVICVLSESANAQSRIANLSPVKVLTVDESMQTADDFVVGWEHIAQKIIACNEKAAK